jgi:hypothetical protein
MKRIALAISLCILSPAAVAATTLKGAVYSPEPGVICDKKGGFCADSEGLSVAMTKMYIGAAAEKKLTDRIKKEPGVQDYDTTTFTLTNGVSCDCKAKKCKLSKYEDKVDAAHTKALFGAAAAPAAPMAPAKQGKSVTLKGAVYSPDPGAICDKKGGFCADYEGVSVALTKMYLGAKAEQHLMDAINKVGINDFDATTFTMSDGIYCDCKAKQCKDKLSGKPDAAHTRALFGK